VVSARGVREAFRNETEFDTSPLYRALSQVVAANDRLLELAAQGRPGQHPTFLFFGAVHHALLSGIDHPLRSFYPSIVGDLALAPADAGPALISFCAENEDRLAATIRSRLVQTSHVQRSLALRLGLSVIAPEAPGPVHLIEVGASAGLNLRFDKYGYRLGDRRYGDLDSPVQIAADQYGRSPLPDLDDLAPIASTQGVDLNPVDVTDPDARRWLEALVWPENGDQRALLSAALTLVALDPPAIHRGDAIDTLPGIGAQLPAGEPRVVFHCATRIHVPHDRRPAFDRAIASVGDTGPLWWLALEDVPDPQPRAAPGQVGWGLVLRRPNGMTQTIAAVNGHLRWIKTL
jgi:hypothetical protein